MFHFPGFASTALCIQAGITAFSTPLGFPIRKPPDRSLVGGSPRLFAATRVLHRLLVPRHPSRALSSLQFSNFSRPPLLVYARSRFTSPHSSPSQVGVCFSLAPESPQGFRPLLRTSVEIELFVFVCKRTFDGADRARTGDIRLAKPALSQTELQPLGMSSRRQDLLSGPG